MRSWRRSRDYISPEISNPNYSYDGLMSSKKSWIVKKDHISLHRRDKTVICGIMNTKAPATNQESESSFMSLYKHARVWYHWTLETTKQSPRSFYRSFSQHAIFVQSPSTTVDRRFNDRNPPGLLEWETANADTAGDAGDTADWHLDWA